MVSVGTVWKDRLPGVGLSVMAAMAASFISSHYGGPIMLYALLFGMVFNFLSEDEKCRVGMDFSCKFLLRVGVALMGAQIVLIDIMALGWTTLAIVFSGLLATLTLGVWIGRSLKLAPDASVLSAGAVAICGASAALAISTVLPKHEKSEQNTLLTIVGVTGLSTIAMVLYPVLLNFAGASELASGIFLGATVHDVAQVVGAGHMMSGDIEKTAVIVKLMRVASLAPLVMIIGLFFRSRHAEAEDARPPVIPLFLLVFIGLVIANSLSWLPLEFRDYILTISKACMVTAVAALGFKTSLRQIFEPGKGPLLVLSLQTLLVAAVVGIGLAVSGV